MFTQDNVIAVSFPEEADAYEELARLKELDSQGSVGVREAGVVTREQDGKITIKGLADISKSIRVGPPGLLAEVTEPAPEAVAAVMARLNGAVVRRSAADVELEVVAAEDAQRAAKKKARHELREGIRNTRRRPTPRWRN